jgi:hypothetical protein
MIISQRITLAAAIIACLAIIGISSSRAEDALPEITVYKSPTCGCCGKWAKHLEDNGFKVKVVEKEAKDINAVKQENRLPTELASCHTGVVGGYAIEGHVPADDIKKLLKEKPAIKGIAVPRMPAGSPGMESDKPESYDVMSYDAEGKTAVFSHR